MDEDQKLLYKDLSKEMMHYVEQDDNLVVAQNEFVLATRLRQALVCPAILSPSLGVGAAIKDFVESNEPEDGPYVIFTPFTSAFSHFNAFLCGKGFRVQTLQGAIGSEERDSRISVWRRERSVCICSVLYAQAFSLEPATRCYFIGYDWDPDNNRQAEKRLHRLSTHLPITAYYYTFRSTFDERLCAIVNIKQINVNTTIPSNLRKFIYGDTLR
jgi:SNF2 family DNA or RNA helicase